MSYKCSIDVEYFLLQQFDYLPVCMSVFIYLSIFLSIAMSLLQHLVTKSRKSRSAETILSEKVSQRTAKLHFVSGHTKLICPKTKEERVYVDSLTHVIDIIGWKIVQLTRYLQLVDWSILLVIFMPNGIVPSTVFQLDEIR